MTVLTVLTIDCRVNAVSAVNLVNTVHHPMNNLHPSRGTLSCWLQRPEYLPGKPAATTNTSELAFRSNRDGKSVFPTAFCIAFTCALVAVVFSRGAEMSVLYTDEYDAIERLALGERNCKASQALSHEVTTVPGQSRRVTYGF